MRKRATYNNDTIWCPGCHREITLDHATKIEKVIIGNAFAFVYKHADCENLVAAVKVAGEKFVAPNGREFEYVWEGKDKLQDSGPVDPNEILRAVSKQ